MAKINIESRLRSINPDKEETFVRAYDRNGVLHEERITACECDYHDSQSSRFSTDHGKTWSEWEVHCVDQGQGQGRRGKIPGTDGDELISFDEGAVFNYFNGSTTPSLYDPNTGCEISATAQHYHIRGHDVGYFEWWETGADNWRPHAYLVVKHPDGRKVTRLLELEEGGADFDPANPRNPAFLDKNRGTAQDVRMLSNGEIVFYQFANMEICCKRAGVDVNTFFPSCPKFQMGLLLGHLHWNEEKQDYDITYSNPIMLSDLQSSRGVMEPQMEELPDGRLLIVLRGSNTVAPQWNTRIGAHAPGFKWFTISNDGGKTFPPLMPWYFDTREVVYSPATMCRFFRSSKNGKLYWMGNVYKDAWRIEGNSPRNELYICQVDDEECCLIKDTLTLIDTMRGDETDVELSNFTVLENPLTQQLELRLTKVNFNGAYQGDGGPGAWYTEAWEYYISFDD